MIQHILFIAPKILKLNDTYNISINECSIKGVSIDTHIFNKKIYVKNIYSLPFDHPTYCLKLKTFNNPVKFSLIVNNKEYNNSTLNESFKSTGTSYIYFNSTNDVYKGSQNNYMNDVQNNNSINLSKIDKIHIVFHERIDIANPVITQLIYKVYNKTLLESIFKN